MYAIQRVNSNQYYVAIPGYKFAYTNHIDYIWFFISKEGAEKNRCPDNEIVVDVSNKIINNFWIAS